MQAAKFLTSASLSALKAHLATTKTPLHIGQALTAHWPARSKWSLSDNLSAIRRGREDKDVEIEVGKRGRGYMDPEFQRINMGLGLFLDAFVLGKVPSADPDSLPTAYLAQSDLLDDEALAQDVPPLEVFNAGPQGTVYRRTIWIGPERSFTPFHRDPYIGLYSQVMGSKTFYIVPPDAAAHLDASTDPRHANTSTIPLPVSTLLDDRPDPRVRTEDIHPLLIERSKSNLEKAFGLPGACRVTLNDGESVLVPEGWWHSAEGGEEPGIGVGAWFR